MSIDSEVEQYLLSILPGSRLKTDLLDHQIKLCLLDQEFDDRFLDQVVVDRLGDAPPYWIFCWASGMALSKEILSRKAFFQDKRVLDFGSGCGVVAIAAALAGADVTACEIDPIARKMIKHNSNLNEVEVVLVDDLQVVEGKFDVVLAADVLYEKSNLKVLDLLLNYSSQVVFADSRLKSLSHSQYDLIGSSSCVTFPDYNEARAHNEVLFFASTNFFNLEPQQNA